MIRPALPTKNQEIQYWISEHFINYELQQRVKPFLDVIECFKDVAYDVKTVNDFLLTALKISYYGVNNKVAQEINSIFTAENFPAWKQCDPVGFHMSCKKLNNILKELGFCPSRPRRYSF